MADNDEAAAAMPDNIDPDFVDLLSRIGLNDTTVEAITEQQGIDGMPTLIGLISEDQVKRMAKLISYSLEPIGDDAFISAVSATKLHAIWYWGILRQRCGRPVTADEDVLTDDEIMATIQRIQFEEQVKEAAEEGSPKKPFILKKIEKFNEWLDAFNAYMYSIRGAARIPLPYVYRAEGDVTDEMRDDTYTTTDEEFMALFALSGSYYNVDNECVFNELMQFVLGGPGESVIKKYRSRRDGRGAMLALCAYANGTDAIELRASNAYQVINSMLYKRQSKNFTLDDFFARLRDAYNILAHEDVNQPVQELRKWTETLDKIQDPQLYAAKLAIKTSTKGDTEKTFENLALKVKELAHEIYKSKLQDRMVGLTEQKKSFKDSELHAGNWTKKDWALLNPEQRKKIQEMRKQTKSKRKDRSAKAAGKDAGKDIASSSSEESGNEEKTDQAGKQFGRNAHKKSPKKKGKK